MKLEMKVKEMNLFVRIITFGWAAAITLAPFGVYFAKRYYKLRIDDPLQFRPILHHETIHWKQQLEMWIVPFYLWYLSEWFLKLFKYGTKSYSNISFEREANMWENKPLYLLNRPKFAWFRYL